MENRLPQMTFGPLTITSQENDEPPKYESPPSYESALLNNPALHGTSMPCYPYSSISADNQQQTSHQNVQESNINQPQQLPYRPHDSCSNLCDAIHETYDHQSFNSMEYTFENDSNLQRFITNGRDKCKINNPNLKWWLKTIFDIATLIITASILSILKKQSFVHDQFTLIVEIFHFFYVIFQICALLCRLCLSVDGVSWKFYAMHTIAQGAFMLYIGPWRTNGN